MGLVAWLVSITSCDNRQIYVALCHCFYQLVFKFIDILDIWLDDAYVGLGCFDHVQNLLANVCFIRRLLLEKLTFRFLIYDFSI